MSNNKVACIIPARMGSSRFPGKPIAKILGHAMVEHVYRRVQLAKNIDEIYIATCDREIAEETERFGGKAIMTSPLHTRGTGRVAEAAKQVEADIVINVQGDEPLVDPEALDRVSLMMKEDPQIRCVNLIAPIVDWPVFADKNVVKTTIDQKGKVLYFSRLPIPTCLEKDFQSAIKQIGIYFFRKDLLFQFNAWEETPLEKKEAVDMLRILENGVPIETFMTKDMISVDTPEELTAMENLFKKDVLCQKIFDI